MRHETHIKFIDAIKKYSEVTYAIAILFIITLPFYIPGFIQITAILLLMLSRFLTKLRFARQVSKEEFTEAWKEKKAEWEANNGKIDNITDENIEEYKSRLEQLYYQTLRTGRDKVDRRPLSFYIRLPDQIELGFVDEIFGIIIGIFLSNILLSANSILFFDILTLFFISLIISTTALGMVALKGKDFFLMTTILLTFGLREILIVSQTNYNDNNLKFLVYAVFFMYMTKEITLYAKSKLSNQQEGNLGH